MKGSSIAGVNPIKLGGAGKGTSVANTGFKAPGTKAAKVAPNQKLNTKNYKAGKTAMGTVQGLTASIHRNRGGSAMKAIFRGKA